MSKCSGYITSSPNLFCIRGFRCCGGDDSFIRNGKNVIELSIDMKNETCVA